MDRWFNVRLERPGEKNKYRNLPAFVRSMGLQAQELFPSLILSAEEKENGKHQLEILLGNRDPRSPIMGIFVGGRKSWGKRWPEQNFKELISNLHKQCTNVIVFIGPEERDLSGYFEQAVPQGVPLVFEPSPRMFASLVWGCDLFVCCDSGPMHLACALGVRTIAIFLFQHSCERWAPPSSLAHIVYQGEGRSYIELLEVCRMELDALSGNPESPKMVNA